MKTVFNVIALILFTGFISPGLSQVSPPFSISLEAMDQEPVPALQSFAFATYEKAKEEYWVFIGGRTNGFHGTAGPNSTFPSSYANEYIHIVNFKRDLSWKVGLPDAFQAHLSSTNMQHYQEGNMLYCVGGYGSNCPDDKVSCYQTYPLITAIDIAGLVDEVLGGSNDIGKYMTQASYEFLRVTGGELKKMGNYYFLIFGHNYFTKYTTGVEGRYTEEVRRFKINYKPGKLTISDTTSYKDPTNKGDGLSQYHRRDLNVTDGIRPDGSLGLNVFGGVFNGPDGWVHPIYIDQNQKNKVKIRVDYKYSQVMSQYECAHLLMYDENTSQMYTTLLGGISQCYLNTDTGKPDCDDPTKQNLPFVRAITTITQDKKGTPSEHTQTDHLLPSFLGANAIFIPEARLIRMSQSEEILNYRKLPAGAIKYCLAIW